MAVTDRPSDHRGRYVPDGSWPPGREAPEPLERVRRFLNTANRESGADHLETPASLRAWLRREGYAVARRPTDADHGRVLELREAVRELALANHDGDRGPDADHAVATLRRLGAAVPVVVQVAADPGLVPVATGVDGVIAGVLVAVHDAMVSDTWSRLKACRNSHCRWTFYDHSRNASGSWCSTTACGSRMKVRAYRARQRGGAVVVPLVGLLALALASCGGDGDGDSGAQPAPEGSFCEVVSAWSDAVTGTVNGFSFDSPDVADVAERRQLYLRTWDGLGQLASWVDTAAERGPDDAQDRLHEAADRVRAEIDQGRQDAVDLADANYEYASVNDGTLFKTSEKSRSLVFGTLDALRKELGEDVVPRRCGRQPGVVSLPVLTAP